jgi:hypothetical protein
MAENEAIVLIEGQIKAHREQAGKHDLAASNHESNARHQREAARAYYDCIADLEQAKHDIERAAAGRRGD